MGERLYNDFELSEIEHLKFSDQRSRWNVFGVYRLPGKVNRGNHHLYLEAVDNNGERVPSVNFRIYRYTGHVGENVVGDKPPNEPSTNVPIWVGDRMSVEVNGVLSSEKVGGFRTDLPDIEKGATWGHHSYLVVFMRSRKNSEFHNPPTPPMPPVSPPPGTDVVGHAYFPEKKMKVIGSLKGGEDVIMRFVVGNDTYFVIR